MCRCNVFEIETPVCGLESSKIKPLSTDTNELNMDHSTAEEELRHGGEINASSRDIECPVRLTKWRTPVVKVTYNMNGQYWLVMNYREFSNGGKSCPVPNQNFCFTPHEYTTIGQTFITPIPVYERGHKFR